MRQALAFKQSDGHFDDFVLVSKSFLSRKRLEIYSEVKGVNGDLNVYGLTCMTLYFLGGREGGGGGTGSQCLGFHLHCRLLTLDISPSCAFNAEKLLDPTQKSDGPHLVHLGDRTTFPTKTPRLGGLES